MTVALDVLLQQAIDDPSAEFAFFSALLRAELFVHCPLGRNEGRLRIVQFNRPDGLQVLPVFTDRRKAAAASSPKVEIVGLNGRVLLEATHGATLMLNPNDTSCILYPEEVANLLSGRPLARAPATGNASGMNAQVAEEDDLWIGRLVAGSLEAIQPVTALYQLQASREGCTEPPTVLLVLSVPAQYAERAARAATACLEANAHRLSNSVDLTCFDPRGSVPDWLVQFASTPVWRRGKLH